MEIDSRIEWLRPFIEAALEKTPKLKPMVRRVELEPLRHGKETTFEAQMQYEIATGMIDIQIRTHFWATYSVPDRPNMRKAESSKKIIYAILDDLAHELAHAKMTVAYSKATQKAAFKHPPKHLKYWGEYMILFARIAKKLNIEDLEVRFDKIHKK